MALPALATTSDLSARGVSPSSLWSVMLDVASCIVRGYAGSPIAETESTVELTGAIVGHEPDEVDGHVVTLAL